MEKQKTSKHKLALTDSCKTLCELNLTSLTARVEQI